MSPAPTRAICWPESVIVVDGLTGNPRTQCGKKAVSLRTFYFNVVRGYRRFAYLLAMGVITNQPKSRSLAAIVSICALAVALTGAAPAGAAVTAAPAAAVTFTVATGPVASSASFADDASEAVAKALRATYGKSRPIDVSCNKSGACSWWIRRTPNPSRAAKNIYALGYASVTLDKRSGRMTVRFS